MNAVLDASAVLALLFREPGSQRVEDILRSGAAVCTVTLAEIVAVFSRNGVGVTEVRALLSPLPIRWIDTNRALAYRAGELALTSRPFGLSLGDRFCIALAMRQGVPAITADRAWSKAASVMGFQAELIR